jgi:hypothetical protein
MLDSPGQGKAITHRGVIAMDWNVDPLRDQAANRPAAERAHRNAIDKVSRASDFDSLATVSFQTETQDLVWRDRCQRLSS